MTGSSSSFRHDSGTQIGDSYPDIVYNGSTGGTLTLNSTGANINDIKTLVTPCTIKLTSSQTFTVDNFSLSGVSGGQVTFTTTGAANATISKSSGVVDVSYLTISKITAAGGAKWNALTKNGNVNGGSNVGWIFSMSTGFLGFLL